ncbi:MAG: hydrogenase iron-sulfur subunit [Deltaproteobacteria bacterium]|nr:hydrogenase iron-sulfur subunit [Deltaproteobacteria bacterium]
MFVCHCGSNIGGVVRVPEVVDYARRLPLVRHAEDNLYTCSDAGLSSLRQQIRAHELTRVVVASCTPRTHEELFRRACEQAGLNRYLFEFVNLREHCSWIHLREPDRATAKAKELVRLGVAKAALLEPLERSRAPVKPACLVLGAGVAGLAAATSLGRQGFEVHLVERTLRLGGLVAELFRLLPGDRPAADLVGSLAGELGRSSHVHVHLEASLEALSGFVGAFRARLRSAQGPLELDVGTIVVATGARELEPLGLLRHGELDGVLAELELERALVAGRRDFGNVVFINCAGARGPERAYCGRLCCAVAIKNARYLAELDPRARITVLQRDIMAFGTELESEYRRAREAGVRFVRFSPERPPAVLGEARVRSVRVYHALAGEEITIDADHVVLTTPLVPHPEAPELGRMLKVPTDADGFFLEAHVKLRPVEFATDGIFVAGAARFPADVREAVSQGMAAAAKAAAPMAAGEIAVEATTAVCDARACSGCGDCERACPFGAVALRQEQGGRSVAEVNAVVCKGCGACAAACRPGAMQQRGFDDRQLMAMVDSLAWDEERGPEPKILVLACNWCSYAGADMAGVSRLQMPPNCRIVRVMCSARVRPELVLAALTRGIDAVLVTGCHPGDCHYSEGNYHTRRRALVLHELLDLLGIERERFQVRWISAAEGAKFADTVRTVVQRVRLLRAAAPGGER